MVVVMSLFVFFKQKTAYEMRISDWSSDLCSSELEIAFTAYVPHNYPADVEPGLDETAFYDPLNFTYPAGVHICEVEIDPATGITEVVDWVAVDDFGKLGRAAGRDRVCQYV